MRGLGESTYYTKSLKPQLDEIAGSNPYTLEHEVGKRRLRLKIDADANVIENITNKVNEKAPKSNSVSMEWSDGLPMTYTRVEYLESSGTEYIDTKLTGTNLSTFGKIAALSGLGGNGAFLYGTTDGHYRITSYGYSSAAWGCHWCLSQPGTSVFWGGMIGDLPHGTIVNCDLDMDEKTVTVTSPSTTKTSVKTITSTYLNGTYNNFRIGWSSSYSKCRFYELKCKKTGVDVAHFVSTLDPTGAPCMFDLVTRRPFYNKGSGDFLYPTPSTTYSLRRYTPEYAIKTPTGIRKLYHVPENYDGSIEDYANEHNYKRLVEPECPNEEGKYYASQWNETDTELILEWIETEPPVLEEEELPTEV